MAVKNIDFIIKKAQQSPNKKPINVIVLALILNFIKV
jgi:hypothetical protein